MSGRLYNNLIALLPEFRVNPSRPGKCLGEFVRGSLIKGFPHGERSTAVDAALWQRNYECLRALAANTDQKTNPRRYESTATGLTSDQCTEAIAEYLHCTKSKDDDREVTLKNSLKKWLNVKQNTD